MPYDAYATSLVSGAYYKSAGTGRNAGMPTSTGKGSFSAWIKPPVGWTGGTLIMLHDENTESDVGTISITDVIGNGAMILQIILNENSGTATSTNPDGFFTANMVKNPIPCDGNWHHIACAWDVTIDPPVFKAYLDGNQMTNPPLNSGSPCYFQFGQYLSPPAEQSYYNGSHSNGAPISGGAVSGGHLPYAGVGGSAVPAQPYPSVSGFQHYTTAGATYDNQSGIITVPAMSGYSGQAPMTGYSIQASVSFAGSFGGPNRLTAVVDGVTYTNATATNIVTLDSGIIKHAGGATAAPVSYNFPPWPGVSSIDLNFPSVTLTGYYANYFARKPFQANTSACRSYACGDQYGNPLQLEITELHLAIDNAYNFVADYPAVLTRFRFPDGNARSLGGSGWTAFPTAAPPSIYCAGPPLAFVNALNLQNPSAPIPAGIPDDHTAMAVTWVRQGASQAGPAATDPYTIHASGGSYGPAFGSTSIPYSPDGGYLPVGNLYSTILKQKGWGTNSGTLTLTDGSVVNISAIPSKDWAAMTIADVDGWGDQVLVLSDGGYNPPGRKKLGNLASGAAAALQWRRPSSGSGAVWSFGFTPTPDWTDVSFSNSPAAVLSLPSGIWSFGIASPSGLDRKLLRNGVQAAGGYAVRMLVANGGKLYVQNKAGTWYNWNGSSYSSQAAPVSENGQRLHGGTPGKLVFAGFTFTFGARSGNDYLCLINGVNTGKAVMAQVVGSSLYVINSIGTWYLWRDSYSVGAAQTSPDGSYMRGGVGTVPGAGGALKDAAGNVWTFGSKVSGADYYILRNGANTGGYSKAAIILGGVLKVVNRLGNWYSWNGSGFVSITPPNTASGVLIPGGNYGCLITSEGLWTFGYTSGSFFSDVLPNNNGFPLVVDGVPIPGEALVYKAVSAGGYPLVKNVPGQWYQWLGKSANKFQVVGSQVITSVNCPTVDQNYQLVAFGDFNGDGRSETLWRNTTTGAVSFWNWTSWTSPSSVSLGTVGTNWVVRGVGDFNGDGTDDILWRNLSTGEVIIWTMSNGSVLASTSRGIVGLDWTIRGIGDFDGDGKADILWWNINADSTGNHPLSIWFMNGTVLKTSQRFYRGEGWFVHAVADFDGDGRDEIIWRNVNGEVGIYNFSGVAGSLAIKWTSVGSSGVDWQIVGAGDVDGDGKAELIWRNVAGNSGAIYAWGDFAPSARSEVLLHPGVDYGWVL